MENSQTTNEEMKRLITEAIRANTSQDFSVYLFGSRARGDNQPDSDLRTAPDGDKLSARWPAGMRRKVQQRRRLYLHRRRSGRIEYGAGAYLPRRFDFGTDGHPVH